MHLWSPSMQFSTFSAARNMSANDRNLNLQYFSSSLPITRQRPICNSLFKFVFYFQTSDMIGKSEGIFSLPIQLFWDFLHRIGIDATGPIKMRCIVLLLHRFLTARPQSTGIRNANHRRLDSRTAKN